MVEEPDEALGSGLDPLRAAGLYDPASPDAAQRAELLRYLLDRFSVEEILFWVEHTNLVGVSARTIDRPPPFISADDAAERAGVPLQTVIDLRSALGFPVTDPTAASIPATVVDDVKTLVLGTELYGQDDALAFARVLGWAA